MNFKLLAAACVLALTTSSTFAQRVAIGYPPDLSSISPGTNITVEVDRPDTLSGSEEVAIVIALQSCSSGPTSCISPADLLGRILYNGPYDPQFHSNALQKPPHQNFTVAIPANVPQGMAQLSVMHFSLIGAGPEPFLEGLNITLTVV